jgi:hypothetical protein
VALGPLFFAPFLLTSCQFKKLESMKKIYSFALLLILLAGCSLQKNALPLVEGEVKGEIQINDDGCGAIIVAKINGKKMRLYPVNLPESLQQNGNEIVFTYVQSRAPQPEGCVIDMVIALESSRTMKR